MGFARTVGNLTIFFLKSQIPGDSPGGGMIAVGIDSYIIIGSTATLKTKYIDNRTYGSVLHFFIINIQWKTPQ